MTHNQDAAAAAATVADDARAALLADLLGRAAGCFPRRHRCTGKLSFYRCWTPGPVPLSRLIAIAMTRWRIEEDHQLAKQATGLDAGQVIRWTSWHRWTAICLLAYIYLTVTAAVQRQHDAGSGLDAGLIPITVPELLRLLRDTVIPPALARPAAPAALVQPATPPPAPRPPSPPTLERLRRDNTMITTITAAVVSARERQRQPEETRNGKDHHQRERLPRRSGPGPGR